MNQPCLLAFVNNSKFQAWLQGIAESKKLDYYFARRGEQLSQLVKTYAAFMLVVDLTGADSEWLFRHISQIRSTNLEIGIIAFASRLQEATRERAQKYGCQFVFTKSELIKNLPEVIETVLRRGLV